MLALPLCLSKQDGKLLTWYDILTGGHLENQILKGSLNMSLETNRGFMKTYGRELKALRSEPLR